MLEVSQLAAGYGKIEVLHGLSFQVPKGQVVTLIGSNGAGKTTTMRAVSGMIQPRSGSIRLNGREIGGLDSHEVARSGLAHSPEGRRVFPTLSVEDNLTLGAFPRLTGSRPKGDVPADRDRIFELFPRLKERRAQLAGTLSGGEQQMLAMGRALMLNPEILLLDEPSMGLAPLVVDTIFEKVRAMADAGIGILMVEQNAEAGLDVADEVVALARGEVVYSGVAGEARNHASVLRAFLGEAALAG
jgi:branched-chain amino acid transport system ATP-binding protein